MYKRQLTDGAVQGQNQGKGQEDLIQTAGGHNQAGSRISGGRPAGDALLNKGTVSASAVSYTHLEDAAGTAGGRGGGVWI